MFDSVVLILISVMEDQRHGEETVTYSSAQELSAITSRKLLKNEAERQGKRAREMMEQMGKFSKTQMRMKLEQHRECAKHIKDLNNYFSPSEPAVFAYAVVIMDSAILKFSIPEKYRSCFSAACYLIAVKLLVDDYRATPDSLACACHYQWGQNDLVRMEVKVMQTLDWTVPPPCTYLDLLPPVMHELFGWDTTRFPHPFIVSQAQVLLVEQFFLFKPAAVVLGILNFMIQRSTIISLETNKRFLFLQELTQVLDSELHEIDIMLDELIQNPRMIVIPNKIIIPTELKGYCRTFAGDLDPIPEASVDLENDLIAETNPKFPSAVGSLCDDFDSIVCVENKHGEAALAAQSEKTGSSREEEGDSGCDQDSEDDNSSCDDLESMGGDFCSRHTRVSVGEDSGVADSSSDEC